MSSIREWLASRPNAKWVPLFECVDRLEVAAFPYGRSGRRTLKRDASFDAAMIEAVQRALNIGGGLEFASARGAAHDVVVAGGWGAAFGLLGAAAGVGFANGAGRIGSAFRGEALAVKGPHDRW